MRKPLLVVFLTFFFGCCWSTSPNLKTCWNDWLKMTDSNFQKALSRYQTCVRLSDQLEEEDRARYKRALIKNLQKTSNYFFDRSDLPPVDVVRVLRSVAELVDRLENSEDEPSLLISESVKKKPGDSTRKPSGVEDCCESNKTVSFARVLLYAFIALIIFQALALFVLFFLICCTDLLTRVNYCNCDEFDDKEDEWIANFTRETRSKMATRDPEAYPLLTDRDPSKKTEILHKYGSNIGKKRLKEDDQILSDVQLSSSGNCSDSDFEALTKRKPLPKSKSRHKK